MIKKIMNLPSLAVESVHSGADDRATAPSEILGDEAGGPVRADDHWRPQKGGTQD